MDDPVTTHPPAAAPPGAAPPGMAAADDARLLTAIAAGDCRGFDLLVDRYKHRLYRYLRHRIGDHHRAEDLAQETFLRLFRAARAGAYSGQASVATWLFTIANNCLIDHLRASGRRPLTLAGELPAHGDTDAPDLLATRSASEGDPVAAAVHGEAQARADALLSALPEPQRQVVALKVLGELTFAEIAEITGCPIATAKSRLTYGLKKIQEALAPSGRTQP